MSTVRPSVRAMLANPFLLSVAIALPLGAQCGLEWQPGAPVSGIAGIVHTLARAPNGDLVAGGDFRFANSAVANNVARFDGTTWQALGKGVDDAVTAVAAMPNGDIVVTGVFGNAGGFNIPRIARWNGTSWLPLGTGLPFPGASALLALPNGDLIAGGNFTIAGGGPADGIARWDGTAWSALGSGVVGGVSCLGLRANGDLVVGGSFSSAGGVATTSKVLIWNGTTWSAVPGVTGNGFVRDLAVLPGGSIAVIGQLTTGPLLGIANGTTFQPLPLPPGTLLTIDVFGNGDLVVGGLASPPTTGNVTRWNGSVWTQIGNGAPMITRTFVFAANGDLVAAGNPFGFGFSATNAVARYDGTSWTHVGAGLPATVRAIVNLPNDDVLLGGQFTSFGGVAANNVARWRDGAVSPLGPGVDGRVLSLGRAIDGSVVVCGEFASAGGGPANRIARWNGSSWATVGVGLPFAAHVVAAAGGGQVLARSNNQVQYFDGLTWSPFAIPVGQQLGAFAAAPEGDFIVATYPLPGGGVVAARFNHGVFSATTFPGTPPSVITLMGTDVNGKVLANAPLSGGGFEIWQLDGNIWSALGTFPGVTAMALSSLPNGDPLVANVWFGTGHALFRLDGSTPIVLEEAVELTGTPGLPQGLALASTSTGRILVVGDVRAIAGEVCEGFAYAIPTCPSAATPIGTGCTGAAGPLGLVADNLPWLGGTFRSTATGFTAASLGVHAIGTQPTALPLPLGAPGCSLFVTPELLELLLPANGEAEANLAVPRNMALVGLQLRTQAIGLELGASGNLIRLTSTNALQLTLGAL